MPDDYASNLPPQPSLDQLRVLKAEDIFQEDRALLIDLQGTIYKLRITKQNKLILTKP